MNTVPLAGAPSGPFTVCVTVVRAAHAGAQPTNNQIHRIIVEAFPRFLLPNRFLLWVYLGELAEFGCADRKSLKIKRKKGLNICEREKRAREDRPNQPLSFFQVLMHICTACSSENRLRSCSIR